MGRPEVRKGAWRIRRLRRSQGADGGHEPGLLALFPWRPDHYPQLTAGSEDAVGFRQRSYRVAGERKRVEPGDSVE
jgi:hypothetical protein